MGRCGLVAFPVTSRLGAVSDLPGCKRAEPGLPPRFCVVAASLRWAEQRVPGERPRPRCSASEGRTEEQDSAPHLPQPRPADNVKWRCRFQPVPGGFGGAGVSGRGDPTWQRAPWQGLSCLWQTWAQSKGPGCSTTSPSQGVLTGQWFVYARVNCWRFLEAFKVCNFGFSFLPVKICMAGPCVLRNGGYAGKGTRKPVAVKLF